MRIVVVGAGAIGQFYGAQLILAGHDVRFIARRDLMALRSRGLVLRSSAGDVGRASEGAGGEQRELDRALNVAITHQ